MRGINSQESGYSLYLLAVYEDSTALSVTASSLALFAGPCVKAKAEALLVNELLLCSRYHGRHIYT